MSPTQFTITTLALAATVGCAQAQQATDASATAVADASTDILLTHHLSSFLHNDLEAVVSDYSDESVLVTATASYTGPAEIRRFFAQLMAQFPTQKTNFQLDKMVVDRELVFIVWHATTPTLKVPLGTDTFVLKDGKIHRQTFAGAMQQVPGGW